MSTVTVNRKTVKKLSLENMNKNGLAKYLKVMFIYVSEHK